MTHNEFMGIPWTLSTTLPRTRGLCCLQGTLGRLLSSTGNPTHPRWRQAACGPGATELPVRERPLSHRTTARLAFGRWCNDLGFDMDPSLRSNAMWLAENWSVLGSTQDGLSDPTAIRKACRKTSADNPPTPDLSIDLPPTLPAGIEVLALIARTVIASMAERGEGQEQATPKKYLAKKARGLGMEAKELTTPGRPSGPQRSLKTSRAAR